MSCVHVNVLSICCIHMGVSWHHRLKDALLYIAGKHHHAVPLRQHGGPVQRAAPAQHGLLEDCGHPQHVQSILARRHQQGTLAGAHLNSKRQHLLLTGGGRKRHGRWVESQAFFCKGHEQRIPGPRLEVDQATCPLQLQGCLSTTVIYSVMDWMKFATFCSTTSSPLSRPRPACSSSCSIIYRCCSPQSGIRFEQILRDVGSVPGPAVLPRLRLSSE